MAAASGGFFRRTWETADFFRFNDAAAKEAVVWTAADKHDPPRDDLKVRPQLYNLDCTAYESVLLGLFTIWRGDYRSPSTDKAKELLALGRPKQNSLCVGFSRDGFHWDRTDRQPFLSVSEKMGDWNWGNLQSTAPGCLVVGDELWFYVSGRAGKSFPGCNYADAGASTGFADRGFHQGSMAMRLKSLPVVSWFGLTTGLPGVLAAASVMRGGEEVGDSGLRRRSLGNPGNLGAAFAVEAGGGKIEDFGWFHKGD